MENATALLPYRQVFTYQQHYSGSTQQVFPLLCPEREREWLDGWDYKMIYSQSGLIEQDCIFQTGFLTSQPSTWVVTNYDQKKKAIEFVRFDQDDYVIKVNIRLEDGKGNHCVSTISYQYTAFNQRKADFLANHMEDFLDQNMDWWEQSINHFLETGRMLKKQDEAED